MDKVRAWQRGQRGEAKLKNMNHDFTSLKFYLFYFISATGKSSRRVASHQRERISLRSPDWRWSWAHGCAAPSVSPAGPETVGGEEGESIHDALKPVHERINEKARTPVRSCAHMHILFWKFLSVNIQHPLPVASLLSSILFDILLSSDSGVCFIWSPCWMRLPVHTPSLSLRFLHHVRVWCVSKS